ncbi:MAG: L-ribulose-5-phosphate 4-epimerase [Inconstantimicrobium porci]|uniref:L-ribulose-5-phosphate 4-epimerase n=1 Tax=Inconstantimicrobium porci TaxID=2652291 RepID=UPI002A91B333|nr:L-ribulose-5-phosphate 4-epimerase [Inconstantimicrobium porci]MDY5912893.1 L-ribulose-5-phosphate 4-epimerase [Inconstantimicrobium porci]
MLENLKKRVCEANLDLFNKGVVIYTWGNVSEIDRETNLVVIKPSGVSYDNMKPEDMVVVDFDGNVVEGKWNPSSDTATHLELYKNFKDIGGITHTHSINAVAFAQAGTGIPALGTTHADYFYGNVPCTRELTKSEVENEYEKNTGKVIVETIKDTNVMAIPGILVKNHGPFTWGKNAADSVYNAVVLENVAEMTLKTLQINPDSTMNSYILDKHYNRKHGKNAYYGQNNK